MEKIKSGWYLLYTRPKFERKVSITLADLKIENLLPVTEEMRASRNRRRKVYTLLFPRYVFVRLDALETYYKSLAVDGVSNFVRFGKEWALVKESVISNLQIINGKREEIEVLDRHFSPSEQLVINSGPFKGLQCELIQINGKRKGLVRVSLLQRSILVSLNWDKLERISDTALFTRNSNLHSHP